MARPSSRGVPKPPRTLRALIARGWVFDEGRDADGDREYDAPIGRGLSLTITKYDRRSSAELNRYAVLLRTTDGEWGAYARLFDEAAVVENVLGARWMLGFDDGPPPDGVLTGARAAELLDGAPSAMVKADRAEERGCLLAALPWDESATLFVARGDLGACVELLAAPGFDPTETRLVSLSDGWMWLAG